MRNNNTSKYEERLDGLQQEAHAIERDWRDVFIVLMSFLLLTMFLVIGWNVLVTPPPKDHSAAILAAIAELKTVQANSETRLGETLVTQIVAGTDVVIDKLDQEGIARDKAIYGLKQAIAHRHKNERFFVNEPKAKPVVAKTTKAVIDNDDKDKGRHKLKLSAAYDPDHRKKLTAKPAFTCPKGQHPIDGTDYCVDDKKGTVAGTTPFVKQPVLDYDPANNKVKELK